MIAFVGSVAYAREVLHAMVSEGWLPVAVVTEPPGPPRWQRLDDLVHCPVLHDIHALADYRPRLVVVAGWRHIVPPDVLDLCPVVGFHSARLPEYPGRAPVPWALLRGDSETANTLLHLTDEADAGDIIDERTIPIRPGDTPDTLYRQMAATSAEMILQHLYGLLHGTAPRRPQDRSRRGPLTTSDGWRLGGWA